MAKFYVFILVLLVSTTNAQIDQVSVGDGYSLQSYYSLSTGDSFQISNGSWDLAFTAQGQADAGIFVNESVDFMGSPFEVYYASGLDWETIVDSPDTYLNDGPLLNSELNWQDGALNSFKDPSNPFDLGWGEYNPTSHTITSSKVFIGKTRSDEYFKFQITDLTDGTYTLKYAFLDGSSETDITLDKEEAGDSPLIYFSFKSGSTIDIPTNYDLIFQRYSTLLDDGAGSAVDYVVTGVLLGAGVQAAIAEGIDPATVDHLDYEGQYSDKVDVIGHDWKFFDFNAGWLIDDARAQFVKTTTGDIYKIVFFDFEGAGTGITTLEKTYITTVSAKDLVEDVDVVAYPNPTTNVLQIKGLKNQATVQIFDMHGKLVFTQNAYDNDNQLNITEIDPGSYILLVSQENMVTIRTIIKK